MGRRWVERGEREGGRGGKEKNRGSENVST